MVVVLKSCGFFTITEGEPRRISINSFCLMQGVLYRYFNSWFVKTRKKIVPVQIEGTSFAASPVEEFSALACTDSALSQAASRLNSDNILVVTQTRGGLNIRKSNLDYRGLKELVKKLEGLC